MTDRNFSQYKFFMSTEKICNIKKLSDVLKEILRQCNLVITKEGIKITNITDTEDCILNCKLKASEFAEFYCEKQTVICFKSREFHKILKSFNNKCSICMYVKKGNDFTLFIKTTNKDVETEIVELCLLNDENYKVAQVEELKIQSNTIILPCSKLIEITKKFNSAQSRFIYIESEGNKTIFSCYPNSRIGTETKKRQVILEHPVIPGQPSSPYTKGQFDLKHLHFFIKGVDVSDNSYNRVKLYLLKDKVIVSYYIGSFGEIFLIDASKNIFQKYYLDTFWDNFIKEKDYFITEVPLEPEVNRLTISYLDSDESLERELVSIETIEKLSGLGIPDNLKKNLKGKKLIKVVVKVPNSIDV